MKMCNSSHHHALILLSLALVLAFAVPLKAQDQPQDYLTVHNEARDEVGVPHLKWSDEVAKYAWNYAQQRKGDCGLVLSGSSDYGENIAWNSSDMSGADAVGMWTMEKSNYLYTSNTCRAGTKCNLYTQVVWKNTEWLGCAKVKCDNATGTFVTCNYFPPGNIPGQWPY